uniref:Uncharacterized protein n=1 Tax=Rhipicephalus microplus TaxID=6941 RepID=A0A6G5A0B5_RHIMP
MEDGFCRERENERKLPKKNCSALTLRTPRTIGAEDLYVLDEEELENLEKTMTDDEKKANKERALSLKGDGNVSFKAGQYLDAMEAYTQALKICPLSSSEERSVLYSNRGATWARLEKRNWQ